MMGLKGKVVCVTGASRGLGASIARASDSAGARLVLASRLQACIDELAAGLHDAIAVQSDVRDPEDLDRLRMLRLVNSGALDVLVNNAGVAVYGPAESLSVEAVHHMIDTNLKGVIFGSQAAYRVMKKQRFGHIINISSVAGRLHLKNEAVYNASKWGSMASRAHWRSKRHYNVRVTTLCPGGIDTPFWKEQDFHPYPPITLILSVIF